MNAAYVCSSGCLAQANSHNGFSILAAPGLEPGGGRRAEVTIVNLGSLSTAFRLFETQASSEFGAGDLVLEIKELRYGAEQRVFLGEIGAVPAEGLALDRFEAGESRTYRFTLLLRKGAPDDDRQRSAGASYRWNLAWPDQSLNARTSTTSASPQDQQDLGGALRTAAAAQMTWTPSTATSDRRPQPSAGDR